MPPPENERGRPGERATSGISTRTSSAKIEVSLPRLSRPPTYVSLPERPGCRHDAGGDCDVHGCPYCQDELEQKPWIDPCATCEQLRAETFAATLDLNPAWKCELSDCLHCEDDGCGLCMNSGRVCRWCLRCPEHEEETGAQCERERWSQLHLDQVTYFVHSYYDPATGRWS